MSSLLVGREAALSIVFTFSAASFIALLFKPVCLLVPVLPRCRGVSYEQIPLKIPSVRVAFLPNVCFPAWFFFALLCFF